MLLAFARSCGPRYLRRFLKSLARRGITAAQGSETNMQQPFDYEAVDGLLANAIVKFCPGRFDDWDPADPKAGGAAAVALSKGDNGHFFLAAGFDFAARLCCEILSDPLHVDRDAVEAAFDAA